MTFIRTSSGLGNQFLFYDVDAVVFVEGGQKSWSIEEIHLNNYNDSSIDIIYWRNLFNRFKSASNIKFKAVGSKTTIKAIAEEIIRNNFNYVIAAMDSEFDDFHNLKLSHKNVLYTKGYSWENDVWDDELTFSILEDISGEEIDKDLIAKCFNNFIEDIKESVIADAYLFANNLSFFPKQGHLKCIDCTLVNEPKVIPEILNELLDQITIANRQTINEYGEEMNIDAKLFCYGHLLNDFCYHLIRYVSTVILSIKLINKDLLERMAIAKFCKTVNNEITDYYQSLIGNSLSMDY
jgi:hypothetical protein